MPKSKNRKYQKRIEELQTICGEAYQAVGYLAFSLGVFSESKEISKLLDNLSNGRLLHKDILPFGKSIPDRAELEAENARLRQERDAANAQLDFILENLNNESK